MDFFSVVALVVFIGVVLAAIVVRKRKEYKYSLLDISGIILNTVLGVMVYPPLSLLAMLIQGGPAAVLGDMMPTVCVAGVGASILLRRRERPVASFLWQFSGLVFFALTVAVSRLGVG